jgi:tetratricopeptide (TPR) repeat protein
METPEPDLTKKRRTSANAPPLSAPSATPATQALVSRRKRRVAAALAIAALGVAGRLAWTRLFPRAQPRDLLRPWLERESDDLDVLNALGMALATAGRPREALDVLERARRAHPTNTQVLVNVGTVCLMNDDQTLYNLGSYLWQSGRRDEARPYLEAYLRQAPPAPEARDIARVRKLLQ